MSEQQNTNPQKSDHRKSGRRRRRGRGKPGGDGKGQPRDEQPRDQRAQSGDTATAPRSHQPREERRPNRAENHSRHNRQPSKPGPTKPQAETRSSGSGAPNFKKDRPDKDRGKRDDRNLSKDRGSRMVKELSQPTDKALREQKPTTQDFRHTQRRYGLVIYDNFVQAKSDLARLQELEKQYDQLNVVIRAEGNMDDPELTSIGRIKVFAGAAWTLIHERRKQDGWYEEPR